MYHEGGEISTRSLKDEGEPDGDTFIFRTLRSSLVPSLEQNQLNSHAQAVEKGKMEAPGFLSQVNIDPSLPYSTPKLVSFVQNKKTKKTKQREISNMMYFIYGVVYFNFFPFFVL